MVNRDLLARKLAELATRIGRVRSHTPASDVELAGDQDSLDLVSFNLMLCVQTCVDITAHLIADEGWPAAATIAESFERLVERSVITGRTGDALREAVGLRNIVAHGYSRLDVKLTFRAATQGVAELDAFAQEVAAWGGAN